MPAGAALVDALHAALPQTQCTRCGYADCRSYAVAIVEAGAAINRCPPGGADGVDRLARLAGRTPLALDAVCGAEGPRVVARIDEAACIGCALCLKACPVDAILGAAKQMHVVIAAHCTGCELCLPVCPVDCIGVENASGAATGWRAWSDDLAATARRRYADHGARLAREAGAADAAAQAPLDPQQALAAALARARADRPGA